MERRKKGTQNTHFSFSFALIRLIFNGKECKREINRIKEQRKEKERNLALFLLVRFTFLFLLSFFFIHAFIRPSLTCNEMNERKKWKEKMNQIHKLIIYSIKVEWKEM